MRDEGFKAGLKAGMPLAAVALLVGASFGVLGREEYGILGAVLWSALIFAGAAQFAATAVLAAGGPASAAIIAGVLMNLRFLPMGVAIAASMRGPAWKRALEGQANVDASWAMAAREGGRFDVPFMIGATIPNYPAWVLGTLIGGLAGEAISDIEALGLDALFPAFFLALLWTEAREHVWVAVLGAAIALALVTVAPPGIPVLAASLAALVFGFRRR